MPNVLSSCSLITLESAGNHEAGPAAAGVKLGAGEEQHCAAAGTVIVAGFVVLREQAGKGPFRALFAQHMVLLGRKFLAPFGIAVDDFFRRIGHGDFSYIGHVD